MNFKKFFLILFTFALFTVLAACTSNKDISTTSPTKPNAEEVLSQEKDADIFQLNGTIYETNIDWVDELEVTKSQEIGIIKQKSKSNFEDGTASTLEKGTKIFSVKERDDVLLVEVNGEIKKYYALTEG